MRLKRDKIYSVGRIQCFWMSKQTLHILPMCCKRLSRGFNNHLLTFSYWIWFGDKTERWDFLCWFSLHVDLRGSISDSKEEDEGKFWRTCGPLLRLLPVKRHSKTTREFNCRPTALEKDMRIVDFLQWTAEWYGCGQGS